MALVGFIIWQGTLAFLAVTARKSYWKYFFSSCIATTCVLALAVEFVPKRSSSVSSDLINWTYFTLLWTPITLATIAFCAILSPLQFFWSPVDLISDISKPRAPVQDVEYLYDPGAGSDPLGVSEIKADVVAIHGLGSSTERAWTHKETGKRWLEEFLPKAFPEYRILGINHDSRWDAFAPLELFRDYGEGVLEAIKTTRTKVEEKRRPIIFLGHSFGGILIKKALVQANEAPTGSFYRTIADFTAGALFLGTPHGGTSAATWGGIMSFFSYWRGSRAELLEFISPDGTEMDELHTSFIKTFFDNVYMCNFFENRPESWRNIPLFATVTRKSAEMRPKPLIALDTDHRGLVKFPSASDPNYLRVITRIKEAHEHWIQKNLRQDKRDFTLPFNATGFPIMGKFVGRNLELALMDKALIPPDKATRSRRVVLHGLGGIGKTQIAVEYANSRRKNFSAVFWISAKSEEVLKHMLAAFAERIPLQDVLDSSGLIIKTNDGFERAYTAVKEWLDLPDNHRWLIVFDNVDKHQPSGSGRDDTKIFDIRHHIPGQGNVIITTRLADLRRLGEDIEIEKMSEEESLQILCNASGVHADEEGARALTNVLGGLPLALNDAGAYIYAAGITPLQYSSLYDRQTDRMLKEMPTLSDYDNGSTMTTWEISLSALKNSNDNAARFLELCAFLDSSDLFFDLFHKGTDYTKRLPDQTQKVLPEWLLGIGQKDFTFYDVIKPLRTLSFIRPNKGLESYSVHPLVQEWARLRLHVSHLRENLGTAFQIVGWAVPMSTEPNYWILQRRLLRHAESCLDLEGKIGGLPTSECAGYFGLALLYESQDNFSTAINMWEHALKVKENTLGPDHDEVLKIVLNLTTAYTSSNRLAEAENMGKRAHKALSQDPKDGNDLLGTAALNLGLVYDAQDRLQEALEMSLSSLALTERSSGPTSLIALKSVHNTANAYARAGRFKEAEIFYQRALEGKSRSLGEDHPEALATASNLGLLYIEMGKLQEAQSMILKVLVGYETTEGPDNTKTLDTVNNLGKVYQARGRIVDAQQMMERATKGYEIILGRTHPSVLTSLGNTAQLYEVQGDYDKAREVLEEALKRCDGAFPAQHTVTLYILRNLADLHMKLEENDQAKVLFERVLAGYENTLGFESTEALITANNLSIVYKDLGLSKECEEMLLRCFSGSERKLGPKHAMTLTVCMNFGDFFDEEGKVDEAKKWYKRALAGQQETLGSRHPDTLRTMTNLGAHYRKARRLEKASTMYNQALAGYTELLGEEHLLTLTVIQNLGILTQDMGDLQQAEPYLLKARAGKERIFGHQHASTLGTVYNLGNLYQDLRNYSKASECYEEALEGLVPIHGIASRELVACLIGYGKFALEQNQLQAAERRLEQAVVHGCQNTGGSTHTHTVQAKDLLGRTYLRQQKFVEAVALFEQAHECATALFGTEHPTTRRVLGRLLSSRRELESAQ